MFNKTMAGFLSFALACSASLSAQRLLVVTNVPKEVDLQTAQENTKQLVKSVFGDRNVGFETGKSTPAYMTVLSMPARNENDALKLRDAVIKGLLQFVEAQGKQGMQKFFEEKISLLPGGAIIHPIETGNRHDVVLYANLPQGHKDCAYALYKAVAQDCENFRNLESTWRPFVILGSFPRLVNPAGLEGNLKNLFPQAANAKFELDSLRILLEGEDGSMKPLGQISLENDIAQDLYMTVTWENASQWTKLTHNGKATSDDLLRFVLASPHGKPAVANRQPAQPRANKPAAAKPAQPAKAAKAGQPADADDEVKPAQADDKKPAVTAKGKHHKGTMHRAAFGRRNGRRVSLNGLNRGQRLGAFVRMKMMNKAAKPVASRAAKAAKPARANKCRSCKGGSCKRYKKTSVTMSFEPAEETSK